MDPNDLALLVEIQDAGNLSQAARRLKMTRANVSYRLAQLERAVGAQLFRRTTRHVEATELGLRLYQHGLAVRNELLAAQETLASLGQGLQGRVRLSVPSGYGQMVMTPWLIAFKRQYPGVVLDVLFVNRVDDLLREEVDIAVRIMAAPPPTLVARDMGRVRYLCCAAAGYAAAHGLPQTLAQLRQTPLITAGVVGRELRLAAYRGEQREEVSLEPTLISEHFPFLREAILAGLGVGLVPDYVVQDAVDSGAIVTALDDLRLSIFGDQLFMLYMPNRHQTRSARALIDFLLQHSLAAAA